MAQLKQKFLKLEYSKCKYLIFLIILVTSGCSEQKSNSNLISSKNSESVKEKFIWNFNSQNNYVYSYEQITSSITEWRGQFENIDTSQIISRGNIEIKSKGDDKADFVQNLKVEIEAFNDSHDDMPIQTLVIPGMNENGNFEPKRQSSDIMSDLIFALPSIDLKIGEEEKKVVEIPFNIMGSPLYIKGYSNLRYLKDIRPNVALISSEFKIDKLEVPKEIKGEFNCSFVGEAEFEFNYKNNYFESTMLDLRIKMKTKYNPGVSSLGVMENTMESNSKYKIVLVEVKKE